MTKPPACPGVLLLELCVDICTMNILALDTSSTTCLVALEAAGVLHVRCEMNARQHSRHILQFIDDAQRRAGITLEALDKLVWSAGPGSFTGLRIGASICQALSYSLNIPVLSLSSLELLACSAVESFSSAQDGLCIAVAGDARMNGAYWGSFVWRNGLLARLEDDRLVAISELQTLRSQCMSNGQPWLFVGDAWALVGCAADASSVDARALINLSKQKPASLWTSDAQACVPLYLHEATNWKKRERK